MTVNIAPIGHNAPPSDADVLRERLEDENADLITRLAELMQSAKMAPDMINDDDEAGKVADLAKMLHAVERAAGDRQAAEKAPHMVLLAAINAHYKLRLTDQIDAAKLKLRQCLADYLVAKSADGGGDADGKVRVRGTNGSVATLTRATRVVVDDASKIDFAILAPHIDDDAIARAANAYYKATGSPPSGYSLITRYSVVVS